MRTLQKELDDLRELRTREKEMESQRARDDEDEIQILRERCESLEQQRGTDQSEVRSLYLMSKIF